jgi:uncharacterized cupredoxin-like copper-binding protein
MVINTTVDRNSAPSFSLSLEELAAIAVPADIPFIRAIELEIVQSEQILNYTNSIAVYIYRDITPQPSTDIRAYNGELVSFEVLPPYKRVYVHIPLSRDYLHEQTSGNTFVIKELNQSTDLPLIISMLPVMKGIPDSLYSAEIDCKVTPLFEKKGVLRLSILSEEKQLEKDLAEGMEVLIDNETVPYPQQTYTLDSGIHVLQVSSDKHTDERITFTLSDGEVKELELKLKNPTPRISIEAPEDTTTFLDGEKINIFPGEQVEIQEGEHTILFKIGNYSMSKRFFVEKGSTYIISLLLDISIKEK